MWIRVDAEQPCSEVRFAVFYSLYGHLTYRNGFRIRTDLVEGRIRMDSGGFLDPVNGISQRRYLLGPALSVVLTVEHVPVRQHNLAHEHAVVRHISNVHRALVPARYCPPHHRPHFEPCFLFTWSI